MPGQSKILRMREVHLERHDPRLDTEQSNWVWVSGLVWVACGILAAWNSIKQTDSQRNNIEILLTIQDHRHHNLQIEILLDHNVH